MEKFMQVMYDMKAEMGALRQALQQAGICVDAPHQKKNKEQHIKGSQKSKFAGVAKKANRRSGARALRPGLKPLARYHKLFPTLTPKMNPLRAGTWQWQ
jgi:hypothetical protein